MSVLFEPVTIGSLTLNNRIIRSATYYALADRNGYVGEESVALMRTLAGGGPGLIVTGYAFVHESGQVVPDMNGIQTDEHIPGYQEMTRAVHEKNGLVVLQIVHGGSAAYAASFFDNDYLAVSVLDDMPRYRKQAREMTGEDIEKIIISFGEAGRRAREAGFDGVQIHGAHGYLVSQFLSPATNHRDDRWGGSLENRMRFVLEVVRAVKNRAGDDFPVMIKLGCRDFLEDEPGLAIEEGAEVAAALEREGVSAVEISNGLPFEHTIPTGINTPEKEAYYFPEARVVRDKTSVPLWLVGGMRSLSVMESVVESGVADCVSLCRPFIREPHLVRRWKEGDTRPADCISCGGCFHYTGKGGHRIACRILERRRSRKE
ncbi:MAG: hypothetical protein AVO39_08595 [delta proteobacterium MLS_D]|jgi:2,4-dienoyl-CoA reductase-like NADH-dependent reductase (Old Yellow Enzyme family)|nr:MAG: hypothetical protein AVO39_08595 [delta proteobacterium MLS_D]